MGGQVGGPFNVILWGGAMFDAVGWCSMGKHVVWGPMFYDALS